MRHIWLGVEPEFIGCLARHCRGRRAVVSMHKCCCCIPPKRCRQVCLIEHSSNALCKCPIGSLSNTILMRFISNSVLSVDSSSCTELVPFLRHVFSSLIITSSLDLHSQLVLCIGLVVFEGSKCITLLLHWNNSPVSAVVINEGDPVFVAMS